ncbi:MAG: repeat-associated core domain protein [Chitinophagaceae bacterium]|nr:repeat-associated core domain protein [Chitinophagaceae bacterium]
MIFDYFYKCPALKRNFLIHVCILLFIVLFSPLCSFAQPVGATINNPIVMGTYAGGSFNYNDTKNNSTSNGYQNNYGQPSDDIYYRFTVQGSTQIDISHCSSGFDTYMYLLNSSGTLITSNDDYGPLCNTNRASIRTTLAAGTYYIVAEGYGSLTGNIITSATLTVQAPVLPLGATINNPIIMGTYPSGSYTYSDTKNNDPANGFGNDFGQASDDIYYKFTLQNTTQIDIYHCGSGFDTYMHLLNSDGSVYTFNDDSGPVCSGLTASIRTTLPAGTYYIVSEGFSSGYGNITTTVSMVVLPPPPPDDQIVTSGGNYTFSYTEIPESLVPAINTNPSGVTYQWEQSLTPFDGFTPIPGATQSIYSFPAALAQTTYFRRKATWPFYIVSSNIVTITVGSVSSENVNYVREHDVLVTGQTDWKVIDQLPIGQKLQTTTYMDGLGRPIEKISRETATPPDPNNLWGDVVQFSMYDAFGREPLQHLPYTTTTQTGKYKTTPLAEQPIYYATTLGETFPYSTSDFEHNPLNRLKNVKSPGTSWNSAGALGNSAVYEVNDDGDNVHIFSIGYSIGDAPVNAGIYPAKTLYKTISTDENNKQVIEYTNKSGEVILTKTQIDENPSAAHSGWICVYSVYDDFGLLRYRIQPEAVKYLDGHGWSFTGADGQQVLTGLCFRYEYDDKGRNILKKSPGAKELRMVYDKRDRVGFMQDGNQSVKATPEWTFNNYDELDRVTTTSLYTTSESISALQDDLNNPAQVSSILAVSTKVKYLFYDDYNFAGAKAFDNVFDNTTAYSNSDPNVIAIQVSNRTLSYPTGSSVRVLGTSTFLNSTEYYDEKGRLIQSLEDNFKSGTDVTTMQYHWDGRLLSTHSKHTTANTGYSSFSILTKNIFDKIGRVTSLQKKYGSNDFKTIATYDLDDMGRLKTKHLDPGYTGSGKNEMESLAYTYNIHNNITGINKNYALKAAGYDKWANFFGLYLGYDNRDNVFNSGKLDGHVTGLMWNTMGDDAQRKYDFTYDNAGRLTRADFKEKKTTADAWDNTKMDFTVGGSGVNNTIQYDLNGNLQTMFQRGVVIGNNTPLTVDNMQYTYALYSNKLMKVTDNGNAGAANGKLGDFADGTNGSADDYVYDDNGNLVIDLNKNAKDLAGVAGANGIRYNFLDKPEEIHISGKGTIQIVYDADGNKLQKKYTPENTTNTTTTTYINEYVYTGDVLSSINFEEGRIRVMTPVSQSNTNDALAIDGNMLLPNSKKGAYDFFVRDYQQNVRMVLTEEIHNGYNTCTMEGDRSAAEEPYFGQAGVNNEVSQTRKPKPQGWTSNSSTSVSKLSANSLEKKSGPNVLLKVMAGDVITATSQYYFQNNVTNGTGDNLTSDILATLAQSILGSSNTGLAKGNTTNITNQLGLNGAFTSVTAPDANNSSITTPKAYMTILFFDERFNFVSEGSIAKPVLVAGDGDHTLVIDPVKSPKNGYAYVYLSNESNEPVYFDNFKVGDNRGRIIEEDHYYSFGLKIAAISSKKLGDDNEGTLQNNYLYQADFSEFDEDLGWNDFELRNYDPQIGRWIQQDPYDEFPSPYVGMGNDPITNIDPNGGSIGSGLFEGLSNLGKAGVMALGGAIVGIAIDQAAGGDGVTGAIVGAGLGAGIGLGSMNLVVNISTNISTMLLSNVSNQVGVNRRWQISKVLLIVKRGKASPTFNSLLNGAGITEENADKFITLKDDVAGGETDDDGNIALESGIPLDYQVLALTHELTNRINVKQIIQNKQEVRFGRITPLKYAQKTVHLESPAIANQQLVGDELGIGEELSLKYTKKYKTKADLLKKIYKNENKVTLMTGENAIKRYTEDGKRLRKIYLLQQKIKKQKEQLRKLDQKIKKGSK